MSTASPPAATSANANPTTDELQGVPASRSQAVGPARILRGPEDAGLLRPGDILVCATASPGWTTALSIAAGIVSETGGTLSSLAIAAREHGVPAVFAVKDARAQIRDGQVARIDGADGIVCVDTAVLTLRPAAEGVPDNAT